MFPVAISFYNRPIVRSKGVNKTPFQSFTHVHPLIWHHLSKKGKDESVMKQLLTGAMVLMLGLLAACSPQFPQTIGSSKYYVQVDGGEEYDSSGHTRYEYKLEGFNDEGESKNLTFTAGKDSEEDAYLRIYEKKDEVITFEEVDADE